MSCQSCGASSTCNCGDDLLTFPAGPVGPPGLQGQQGPVGATGATGPAGVDGAIGPITVSKFVKDFSVGATQTSLLGVVTAAELTAAGMLRSVYDANINTANQAASPMDFTYEIWYRDTTTSPPNVVFTSATEGTSPRVTGVNVNSLNNIDLTFAGGSGGSYRIIVSG